MKIAQMLAAGRPLFSFEFFPPKDDAAAAQLVDTIADLKLLKPDYVSVTYGAGGSTRTKTLELVARIKHDVGIEAMAHLTCVGHSKAEIRVILQDLAGHGIENNSGFPEAAKGHPTVEILSAAIDDEIIPSAINRATNKR